VTRRVAPPMKTIFGEFWDIEQQTNSDLWEHCDTAYTNVALKAHTDCTYMYNTPLYVVVAPSSPALTITHAHCVAVCNSSRSRSVAGREARRCWSTASTSPSNSKPSTRHCIITSAITQWYDDGGRQCFRCCSRRGHSLGPINQSIIDSR